MRKKHLVAILVIAVAMTVTLEAQQAEEPPRYVWVAYSCPDWGCALEELALAAGDRHVMVLPTRSAAHPWVVIKRLRSGSIVIDEDSVFVAECFGTMADASLRFDGIDTARAPLLVTASDGGMLVICLREGDGRQRSVRH